MRWLWNLAVFLWVAAPVIGFLPGGHPKIVQMALWVIASFAVGATAWIVPVQRSCRVFSLCLLACFSVFTVHGLILYQEISLTLASAWILKAMVILSAATLIAERTSWRTLYSYLVVLTAVQIPILLLEKRGYATFWWVAPSIDQFGLVRDTGTPSGTLPSRASLSILAGFCSIWSEGFLAWLFGGLACVSTSLSGGIPSIARLVSRLGRYGRLVGLALSGACLWIVLTSGARVSSRLEAWKTLLVLKEGWLTGWGFFPISGGFREQAQGGAAMGSIAFTDFHSTWIDWLIRFGLIGVIAVLPILVYIVRQVMKRLEIWNLWTLFLFLFAGTIQSAEGLIVMTLLFLVWLMRINQEESTRVA